MNIDIEEVKRNLVWFYANVDMSTENRVRIQCAEMALEQQQENNRSLNNENKTLWSCNDNQKIQINDLKRSLEQQQDEILTLKQRICALKFLLREPKPPEDKS